MENDSGDNNGFYNTLLPHNAPTWYNCTTPITQGSGCETDSYLICSAEQLAQLAYEVNNGDCKTGIYIPVKLKQF